MCPSASAVSTIVNSLHSCGTRVVQPFFRHAGSATLRQSWDWNLRLLGPKHQDCRVQGQGK